MAKLPWYQWYHRDWLGGEERAGLTLAERGLYRDCLDLNYDKGSIPADPELLFRLLAVDREDFDSAWPRVSQFFEATQWDPTRLTNAKAEEVMDGNEEYRKAQSAHAKKGWEKRRKQTSSDPKGTHSEPTADPKGAQCYADTDADADTERERTSLPLPPLAIEPVNREPGYEPKAGFDRFRTLARRKSELSWKGDEPGRAWAEVVTSAAIEAEVFQGFERWSESKRWADGIFSNWHNWLRNLDFQKTPEGSKAQLSALGKVLSRVREANAN